MHKFSSRVIMEASASNADINEEYGFIYNTIDNNEFPASINQKNPVIKYTKLPDYGIDSRVSSPLESYTLQPRVRRLVILDDAESKTNRSLKSVKSESMNPEKKTTKSTKRKIVTISEDDEHDLHPKFSSERKKSPTAKSTNRSSGVNFKEEKQLSNRTTTRLTNTSKYSKEAKVSAKTNTASNKKEVSVIKHNYRSKQINNPPVYNTKPRYPKEKEITNNIKTADILSKTSISKNFVSSSESERDLNYIKSKLFTSSKCNANDAYKKPTERPRQTRSPPPQNKNKVTQLKELQSKIQPISVIRVPLDKKQGLTEPNLSNNAPRTKTRNTIKTVDCGIGTDEIPDYKHVNVNTDPLPKTIDQLTGMDGFELNTVCVERTVQTESIKEPFDSLQIPNVTLTKDKNESKEGLVYTNTLPALKVPAYKITPNKQEFSTSDIDFCQNASYIISRATLTYTTRQKINFHVVGSNDSIAPNQPPSPLAYPVNVVSVFKNELRSEETNGVISEDAKDKKHTSNAKYTSCLNELKSLNCSYIFNSDKLMKPSDIISTIRVNTSLLPSDYICDQFQRELNFIDSFFESLQYLESCSLSEKCLSDDKVENLVNNSVLFDPSFDVKNSEYDNFLTKIENGASSDDSDTMASKSLCLLNLLIRDEQRRAKNLLFVLKMREDALKDFTKSQILWLEKKKKHENTDISTLKKKQRGALLKLQHECGEMQRMRKALLTLSEKRKVALMKTKKNIELKLKNNVDVEQIILGKKKLKRNTSSDRNTAPLKCFDLSSSGCEESTTSRPTSEAAFYPLETVALVTSAEKCIQTGDSVLGPASVDQSTNTAAENFVVVDGGYLNILFHNLTLPQIFSNGKQYEVNEEALKNIVQSSNNQKDKFGGCNLDKLVEQIKNRDLERSSSPSTARSLVDEFDQYYKNLVDEDRSPGESPDRTCEISEIKDVYVQTPFPNIEDRHHNRSTTTSSEDSPNEAESVVTRSWGCDPMMSPEEQDILDKEMIMACTQTQTGPLPVPVGAAAPDDPPPQSLSVWVPKSSDSSISEGHSVSSQPLCASSSSSVSSLTSPVQSEAEELRRQQLAIEREIKALEQQQCRLLVVREIPDKPPPPYTPPADSRVPKSPRVFCTDPTVEEKIDKLVSNSDSTSLDLNDPFDLFIRDFCQETLERHKLEQTDNPWDACNLLPQRPTVDHEKLSQKATVELKDILKGAVPTVVSGFSSRRSDHIDDILFTEWRRCEPEWTNLHTDEAIVKNQLFESIFQKILTDTIDEYRRTVQCPP